LLNRSQLDVLQGRFEQAVGHFVPM
jgi:hypothetical protein